jgi:hypothetical protein
MRLPAIFSRMSSAANSRACTPEESNTAPAITTALERVTEDSLAIMVRFLNSARVPPA